ncbi:MAG TPA: hypothetical protein VMB27_01130 [Solirubrobacteraceae bacterium]|nr:hypothetical protein [Solirubrobacteraceae bacterium]
MRNSRNTKGRIPSRRASLFALAALVSGIFVAGCGGSSSDTTAASVAGASTTPPTVAVGGSATTTGSSAPDDVASQALAFARCMRASGVPNFPDPAAGGGVLFGTSGLDLGAPAVKAAQAKCRKLLPAGGPPVPGTQTHPTAQTLEKLTRIATCMREHGVPDFPDPRTSVPENPFGPGQGGVITDFDNAILLFPSTLNMHSPAYDQATAACGVLAGKLGRGPHS